MGERRGKAKQLMNIIQRKIQVNGKPIIFHSPENDSTIYGTLSCLKNNKFRLDEIPFAQNDIIVDIGCNVGLLSLLIASSLPMVQVFSFDASTTAIDCLNLSIKANNLQNIQAFNYAVGADDETHVKFYSDGINKSCLLEEGLNTTNITLDCVVEKIKIDKIFDILCEGHNVKYLKMDIEGGEFCIFDRLFKERQDLLKKIAYLHLEVHEFKELGPDELRSKVRQYFGDKVFFDV